MYAVKVYIKPEDVLNKLSEKDRNRFDTCMFTDVVKDTYGGIEIECLLFNDDTMFKEDEYRYRLSCDDSKIELKHQ